ncbi:L,D-transpeptidase family protein [Rhizobium sp. TRM95796]|uniref:L,D-transpeptidase family protein n=1 Tax=Rhizobium sp. TRM95796 TaxID=2979862 RepID=UPI0021E94750|nr:L,D-transpeptidase family protein [Rhizobium sp. TRM95796]MCV3764319.1 L,D-transpeptidase family protein [Rhizobium sp. TRM95796]
MKMKTTTAIVALAVAGAIGMSSAPVGAATLLDFLKGNKAAQRPQQPFAGSLDDDTSAFPDPAAPARPLPKVTGPTYNAYKADALRWIAASKFASSSQSASAAAIEQPEATGSIQTISGPASFDAGAEPRAFMADVKVRAPSEVATAIEKYYATHQGLVWVDANGVSQKARDAMAALADAGSDGLDPADYAVTDPDGAMTDADPAARQKRLMQFEIEMSAAVLTYVQDAQRGRIDPNRISGYYDFKRKTVNLDAALTNVALSGDVKAYLVSRNPQNAQYQALKAELARLKAVDGEQEARVDVAPGTLIKPGDVNPELANVVAAIRQRGSDKLKLDHSLTLASYQGGADYAPEIVELVKAYQTENGLKGDGVVGRGTVRVLSGGDSHSAKINKLVVAMEQMRWLPKDLGPRFVFINQPAFKAYYYNEGREQFEMKVVVGSKANQTYFFQDEIEVVEFNPYWGVPRSIIVNEMLPKLRQDPSYLDRLGYETSVGGQQMSSTDIDWSTTDSVDVRQPPGSDNALGQLKIMFPNSHAIYMHDTPQKKFFGRDMRALSHGCVRLVDPKKMAAAVLNMSVADVDQQIATGKNHQVKVPEKFPVYVSYFTAFPNKDGAVEYFDDVYDRDMYLGRALDATRKARHGQG